MVRILNGNKMKVGEASANLPDVRGAVMGLLYPMVFIKEQVTTVNGYAQKVPVRISTQASIQSFTPQMLKVKPEGQRNWKWSTIHSLTNLVLKNNDRIEANGITYKIMEKSDWSHYGFFEYHAIEDYVDVSTEPDN